MNPKDILIKYWGYSNFRLQQEEIISKIINKEDTLALLPTGGGKSICYQVPALLQEGICIVISPLIALMEDQIRFLQSKGIKSVAITSRMNFSDSERVLTNCIYGNVKFLYLSPEKLRNEFVRQKLSKMNINLIAVDEAHCISEWGHDFRPAYRKIIEIRNISSNCPFLALTATATREVCDDIQKNLHFKKNNVVKSSFFRRNLSYIIENSKNKNKRLLEIIKEIKSSIIIYTHSRKATKEISELLNKNNFSSTYYHAGLDIKIRLKRQEAWNNNQVRIIVATQAFGMGINKSDVKAVIHLFLPSRIEEYFQQAGRAGRNEEKAFSYLLINKNDIITQKQLIKLKHPKIDLIKFIYQKLADFLNIAEFDLPEESIPFDFNEFSKKYKITKLEIYYCLNILEQEEYLKLHRTINPTSKVKLLINKAELYKFQISNKIFDSIINSLLRISSNIFYDFISINEEKISKTLNISLNKTVDLLNNLKKIKVISYQQKHNFPTIKFLQNRKDAKYLFINEKKLEQRKNNDNRKLDDIIKYVSSNDKCRNIMLLQYLSNEKSENCGICDYCTKKI